MFVIYIIRHASGSAYYGSSRNEKQRRAVHKAALRKGNHHSKPLQSAWNEDGEEAFRFEIIETVETEDEMLRRERFWLKQPEAVFNVKKYGMRVRVDHQQRSDAARRQWSDPQIKARMRIAISIGSRGKNQGPKSPYHRDKIAAANRRRGADQIGKSLPAETRAKMSETRKGMKRSLETKAKMAEARRAAWQRPEYRQKQDDRFNSAQKSEEN
jgi:group I intron endonuclease